MKRGKKNLYMKKINNFKEGKSMIVYKKKNKD